MGVHGKMRDRVEKFVVLPFSMGCVSQASVAVAEQRLKKPKLDSMSPTSRNREDDEDDESLSGESVKQSSRFLTLPRPNLSTGVNRLVKGFKSLSQLFIYEDEMEELGIDMEIGCPTDVKHVTHIGWDNMANTNPFMEWGMDDITPVVSITHPTATATSTAPENDSPTTFFSFNNAPSSTA
ncbi:hypothetical protein RND81_04G230200 [Saponaria officinalis]|uniref:CRIB domain-containing protein n=1 Tax=Saponaria officinalis TaxID=3572 RepID=A0AAW1LRI4_SAPOF